MKDEMVRAVHTASSTADIEEHQGQSGRRSARAMSFSEPGLRKVSKELNGTFHSLKSSSLSDLTR